MTAHSRNFLLVLLIFFLANHDVISSVLHEKQIASKWDRVDSLARAITFGSAQQRLQTREQILSILYKEESGYPIVYVNINATGSNNGSSWENACTDLQQAINALADADQEAWIWVAQGVYTSDQNWGCAVHLKSRLMLFGGFSGNEHTLQDRNPDLYPAIIHGLASKRYGKRAVDMEHQTLIDGFILRDSGYKKAEDGSWGGKFSDETGGGGIRTKNWFSIIRNNRITNNHARGGGGLSVWNRNGLSTESYKYYAPIIENNIIVSNYAKCGAGVQIRNSETLFCNNIVADNRHLPLAGEDDHSKGIEIILDLSLSDAPVVINSVIWNNHGNGYFPDLYNHVNNAPDAKAVSMYNCIERGGYGEGLVMDAPLFSNAAGGNYSYLPQSPCIDAGYPYGPADPDDSPADIGVFQKPRFRLVLDDQEIHPPAQGQGWYYEGSRVSFSVDSLAYSEDMKTRFTFAGWEGAGEGAYTGDSIHAAFRIRDHVTETVLWQKDFWFQVNDPQDVNAFSQWMPEDTVFTLRTPACVQTAEHERALFMEWSGTGSGAYSGTDTIITIHVSGPIEQTIHRQQQFCVTTSVEPYYGGWIGQQPPGIWQNADSEVILTAEPADDFHWTGWTGDAAEQVNPVTVRMDSPKLISACFFSETIFPPEITGINDTTIQEDSELMLNLNARIHDPNDPMDSLDIEIACPPPLSSNLNRTAMILSVIPEKDWFGQANVLIRVTDPRGLGDSAAFILTVVPVPDAPGPIVLIEPDDHEPFPDNTENILFRWHASYNADAGDTLSYILMLGDDASGMETNALQFNTIQDTSIQIPCDQMADKTCWQVRAVDIDDSSSVSEIRYFSWGTGIQAGSALPTEFILYPNFPNPFNPVTRIVYALPHDAHVSMNMYDIRGCIVANFINKKQAAGQYTITFNASHLGSGVYLCVLKADGLTFRQKVMLMK